MRILPPADLPTWRGLQRLWQDVSAKPLYAPPNFFRYLKLAWRLRLRFVDLDKAERTAPVGKINACADCLNNCCVDPHSVVLLRLVDIAKLMDLRRTDLLLLTKPTFSPSRLAARPALRRTVNSLAWQLFPILKQTPYGACLALDNEGQCTLYPHWPLSCARFPYALGDRGERLFYSNRCQSFRIHSQFKEKVQVMAAGAVAAYNERLKDFILLSYARPQLADLGLLEHLDGAGLARL